VYDILRLKKLYLISMDNIINNYGPKIKALRLALRLSQWELASRAGISQASISLVERGHISPPDSLLRALRDILHERPNSLDDHPEAQALLARLKELSSELTVAHQLVSLIDR